MCLSIHRETEEEWRDRGAEGQRDRDVPLCLPEVLVPFLLAVCLPSRLLKLMA